MKKFSSVCAAAVLAGSALAAQAGQTVSFERGGGVPAAIGGMGLEIPAPPAAVPAGSPADRPSYAGLKARFEAAAEPVGREDLLGWRAGVLVSNTDIGSVADSAPAGTPVAALLMAADRGTDGVGAHIKLAAEQNADHFEKLSPGSTDEYGRPALPMLLALASDVLPSQPGIKGLGTPEAFYKVGKARFVFHRSGDRIYAHVAISRSLRPDVHHYIRFGNVVTPAGWR